MLANVFEVYPEEAKYIGLILAGYTDLEFSLLHCVHVLENDAIFYDTVLKTMYRTRGETARIKTADALGRQKYINLGLETQFNTTINDIHHCKDIRNQYAHCIWYDDNTKRLGFTNLEKVAKMDSLVKDLSDMTVRYVTPDLLKQQVRYFEYVEACLIYINFKGRFKSGKIDKDVMRMPNGMKRPSKYVD